MNLEQKIVDDILRIYYKYESINKVILFGSRERGDNYL
ncbi:putative nucleotidyltransferase [Clostridium beijerinckii]|nr:putative nucleotidyltransferase [Clostridium beijerinckii]